MIKFKMDKNTLNAQIDASQWDGVTSIEMIPYKPDHPQQWLHRGALSSKQLRLETRNMGVGTGVGGGEG